MGRGRRHGRWLEGMFATGFVVGTLAGGIVAVASSMSAGALTTSTTYTYACKTPLGSESFPAAISATAPSSVAPGGSVSLTGVQGKVELPASLVDTAIGAGVSSLTGSITTFDLNASSATPASINAASTPLPFGPVTLTTGQAADLTVPSSPATVGPWSAGSSGTISFTPGDITISLTLGKFGTFSIPCTPPSSPQVFATTTITGTTTSSLAVTTSSLPSGTVGTAYSATLEATGGTAPYTWSISSGSLPAGLSLNISTGVISGTPTAAGTVTFTVKVADPSAPVPKSATASLSISVSTASPSPAPAAPGGVPPAAGTAPAATGTTPTAAPAGVPGTVPAATTSAVPVGAPGTGGSAPASEYWPLVVGAGLIAAGVAAWALDRRRRGRKACMREP